MTLGVDALPACEAPYLLVPSTFAPGFTLLSSSRAPGASAVCNFCNALVLSRAEHAPRAGQQSNALRAGLGGRQDGPLSARGVVKRRDLRLRRAAASSHRAHFTTRQFLFSRPSPQISVSLTGEKELKLFG